MIVVFFFVFFLGGGFALVVFVRCIVSALRFAARCRIFFFFCFCVGLLAHHSVFAMFAFLCCRCCFCNCCNRFWFEFVAKSALFQLFFQSHCLGFFFLQCICGCARARACVCDYVFVCVCVCVSCAGLFCGFCQI